MSDKRVKAWVVGFEELNDKWEVIADALVHDYGVDCDESSTHPDKITVLTDAATGEVLAASCVLPEYDDNDEQAVVYAPVANDPLAEGTWYDMEESNLATAMLRILTYAQIES